MPVNTTKLGPGTLIFTPSGGSALDVSCQVESASVTWSKNKDDDVRMLCGDVKPGATTYTAQLTGTIDQDLTDTAGVVWFSWDNRGQVVGFEFVPNTAAGAAVTGDVVVDPLDIGGDTGGDDMTSDFTWDCVGEPTLAAAVPAPLENTAGDSELVPA